LNKHFVYPSSHDDDDDDDDDEDDYTGFGLAVLRTSVVHPLRETRSLKKPRFVTGVWTC